MMGTSVADSGATFTGTDHTINIKLKSASLTFTSSASSSPIVMAIFVSTKSSHFSLNMALPNNRVDVT